MTDYKHNKTTEKASFIEGTLFVILFILVVVGIPLIGGMV
jgi:hypothetical protein